VPKKSKDQKSVAKNVPTIGSYSPTDLETEIFDYWSKNDIFAKSMEQRKGAKPFVFLEGPPTANGKPGIHHVMARTFKDLVCRWKTMQGFLVERKAGWDTHGLPVEIEVQKRLDLGTNQEIEQYGIEKFNKACQESVWTYEEEWRKMTERMAFWVDLENPYVTLHNDYIESAWWSLKKMWEKGLLYQDYKVLPYCPQTGTSYSSHEVALGYKEVEEPSVFIKFKLVDDQASVLAWTTTPWTLPGNVGLAVGKDVSYSRVKILEKPQSWQGPGGAEVGEEIILASDLLSNCLRHQVDIIEEFKGDALVGRSYEPLFKDAIEKGDSTSAWTIVEADFVTTTDGTGVVHTAVMYGEEDFNLGRDVGFPEQHTVDKTGKFVSGTHPDLDGRYVKDCDEDIINLLDRNNSLYRTEIYSHDYPFCWRTDHPLLYYAMNSWFVKMSSVKDKLIESNNQVEWAPDWVGSGRFGEWIGNVKDWAISRERFWGTPLPIWSTEDGSEQICIGSFEELRNEVQKAIDTGIDQPPVPDDLDAHRPFVDEFILISKEGKPMRREPFVLDCWFDSGCAFFSQWHYPFENKEIFDSNFPIDYICEGVDQTRGWFYTLLAVSTAAFDSLCYRSCLSLGLLLDKEGKKMSKSKGNVVNPWDHFNKEGADAVRWYLVSSGAPWNTLKFDPDGVKEAYTKFFLTLWNVYKFHSDYASLDNFDYDKSKTPIEDRPEIDRWITSRLATVFEEYNSSFTSWDFHKAVRNLEDFVVNDLSNWYVRRSRRRLWDEADSKDKIACQTTLHEVITTVCQMVAPIAPHTSEYIYLNLTGDSVHLSDWPELNYVDKNLESNMATIRSLAEEGRRIRIEYNRRQRLPCKEAWIVGASGIDSLYHILEDELNIESISTETNLDRFQQLCMKPNKKSLGKKARSELPQLLSKFSELDPIQTKKDLDSGSFKIDDYELTEEDVIFDNEIKEGYSSSTTEDGASLILDMAIDEKILSKGLAREICRRIQAKRKDMNLPIEDTIILNVWLAEGNPELLDDEWDWIQSETRASTASLNIGENSDEESFEIDSNQIYYSVKQN
tara:strand:- start:1614 stop:4811 length:3198 start_codon:yes stop_codon:yes gene_type:complete